MSELFEILSKSIIEVTDKNCNMIKGDFKIKMYKHKYSSYNGESATLFINDEPISREKTKITYSCTCERINTILLVKFLKKDRLRCPHCIEDETKRKNQSDYIKNSFKTFGKIIRKEKEQKELLNNLEYIEKSKISFENEIKEFKEDYYKIHCTEDDYNRLIKNIISINGVEPKDIKFIEWLEIGNAHKYSQYVYDIKNDKLIPFNNIIYKCECCKNEFNASTSRMPKLKLKNYKILCKGCSLCNKAFKIRGIKNILGNDLIYQSKPELTLIEFCNNNNIVIENGPTIDFVFKNSNRTYRIDFYLPKFNMIVEIKDYHVWHRKQVESGIWEEKEKSAKIYCKQNNLTFNLIFTKYLNEFMQTLLRYSLNS